MIRMQFREVRVSPLADTPVLLLREANGGRHLAIWITAGGGNAILSALEDGAGEHPGTHDLMLEVLAALDATVEAVHITDVTDGVFAAQVLVNGLVVPARVSDGVALALRCGAPILAEEALLAASGVTAIPPAGSAPAARASDDQLEQFRAFLDTISPEDFDSGQP